MRNRTYILLGPVLLLGLALCGPPGRAAEQVTGEDVREAIARGKQALFRNLAVSRGNMDRGVLTAMALLNCGVSPKDPRLKAELSRLSEQAPFLTSDNYHGVYLAGLLLVLFQMTEDEAYRRVCTDLARRLQRYQSPNGGWGDYSRTQFALLGLKAASDMGVEVGDEVFENARRWVDAGQNADGGWGYQPGVRTSYGSMSVAGVSNLFITGDKLYHGRRGCDAPGGANPRLLRGLEWLANRFSVRTNPGYGGYHFYYLYGLERVGMLLAQRTLGGHDWYREGAAFLVRCQRADGSWTNEIFATEFAMLFLGKGSKPIAVQKLQYGRAAQWNLDPYDVKNVVERAAGDLATPMTYQVVGTRADAKELALAPALYLQGAEKFQWDEEFRKNLKAFLDQGGFLFAVAACGSADFETSLKRELRQMYPDSQFERLAPDHPVYSARHALTLPALYMLEGMDLGCRTAVLYAPKDVACVWGGDCQCQHENVILHEEALNLGVNLVAYALGFQRLRDKLDEVKVEVQGASDERIPRGALVVGQVYHGGGWNPGPMAIPNLTRTLREQTGMPGEVAVRRLVPGAEEPGEYPVLYMTGYRAFHLTDEQVKALRAYLDHGGFLFADPWCGREEFDEAFRKFCARLYPEQKLERLPKDHAIFQAPYRIEKVAYKDRVKDRFPALGDEPYLEGIAANGRLAVVYSRFNLGCELQGNPMPMSLGVKGPDAYRLAVNVLVYALSH
ncbi:MAG: DUF4159 domain-containing protein [Planctomycetota bacterium]|nr:DUF4159 domain-containing protein [Planctomycetota bacterium]